MPRGFLVKRSPRPGGSYRARPRQRDPPPAPLLPPPLPPLPPPPGGSPAAQRGAHEDEETEEEEGAAACPAPAAAPWPPVGGGSPARAPPEGPSGWGAAGPCSAAGPRAALLERGLSSPASAESFPLAAAFPPAEKLLLPPRTPLPAPLPAPLPPPPGPALKRPPRAKAPAKKAKATRKLSFADEVTTSPVLGLRIKEEAPEGRAAPAPPSGRTPLGEFICQLCKEQYADPLALAQHRCSRIVRVEYRCPECHKMFSCPANLASHRRWHKPRPAPSAAPAASAPPGKENSPERRPRGPAAPPRQHRAPADSAGGAAGGPAAAAAAAGAPFPCPCCHKRFRRQAYLRKHLGTHGAAGGAALAFACALCGARFPSAATRDKHGLWHALRDELLLPAPAEPRAFPCKLCPATFFSAPGLARHATKCHPPPEGRQVLLLPVPVRPGC